MLLSVAAFLLWRTGAARHPERAPDALAPEAPEPAPPELSSAPSGLAPEVPLAAARAELAGEPAPPAAEAPTPEKLRAVVVLVTDLQRSPLSGARVRASGWDAELLAEASTGADGRAHLELPARQGWMLEAAREGHVHLSDYLEAGDELVLELPRALELAGRVLDSATRAPLAGARIRRPHSSCRACAPDEAVSDALGRYVLAGVPAASGLDAPRFDVRATGHASQWMALDTSAATGTLAHDFVLDAGVLVAGRVLGFPGRAALEGMSVSGAGQSVRSDADGRFELHMPDSPLEATLEARGPGHAGVRVRVARAELEHALEILLPRTATLEGSVRDTEGRPVAGVQIAVGISVQDERVLREGLPADELGLPASHRLAVSEQGESAASDEHGNFRIEGLVPGAASLVVAAAEGYRPLRETLAAHPAPGAVERLELRLESFGRSGTIRGRITLNGALVRATVHWQGATREGHAWARGERFELEAVECGRVRLDVRLKGRTHDLFPPLELEVASGATLEHDLELELAMGTITGRVRRADGTPAAGVVVDCSHAVQRLEYRAESDEQGAFAFEVPVLEKPYRVAVAAAGEVLSHDDAIPDGAPLDFELPEAARMRVRVEDATSHGPLADCTLAWKRVGETSFRPAALFVAPDGEGWRTLELPAGPLELLVRADALGYRPAVLTDVVARPDAQHVIALERGLEAVFRLDPAAEAFPADHALFLIEAEALVRVQTASRDCRRPYDPAGMLPVGLEPRRVRPVAGAGATVHALAAGRYGFFVCPDDLVVEPAELEVEPGAGPILLRWSRR